MTQTQTVARPVVTSPIPSSAEMIARVTCKQGEAFIHFDGTEDDLFKKLGEMMPFIPAPDTVNLEVGTRKVILDRKEGKEGRSIPYTTVMYSDLEGLKPAVLPWKMLKRIDPDKNIYHQYEMTPHTMGDRTLNFTEAKGRIGAQATDINRIKPSLWPNEPILFWIRYHDLLNLGYEDYSDVQEQNLPPVPTLHSMRTQKDQNGNTAIVDDGRPKTPRQELWDTLLHASEEFVADQLDPTVLQQMIPFTELQIEKAREIWSTLGKCKTNDQFNTKIRKIMGLVERRIDPYRGQTVKSYYAKEVEDPEEQKKIWSEIIDREDALILSMEAVLLSRKNQGASSEEVLTQVFQGIEIDYASDEEKQFLLDNMFNADSASKALKDRVHRIWKVTDPRQNKRFKEYCETRKVCGTKFLFHGSRTQNWISIIMNSLLLNPNAQINGKAFGYGIYFALSADKSFGYTSASWGNRYNSDLGSCGYMGVYETAYGKSADSSIVHDYSQEWMDKNGYDCLHYHAGGSDGTYSFVRDEIVFYDEGAMTIRYLIEFA